MNKIFWLLVAVLVFLIFRAWFSFGEISGGDAGFYFSETLRGFSNFPYLWISDGLGSYSSLLYSFPYLVLPLKLLAVLDLPWVFIERIVWYWPFLILGIFSSWFFVKTVLPEGKFRFLSPLIYLFNTYILMIIGGGQISIALSYAIAPLVFALFVKSKTGDSPFLSVLSGLVLAIQLAFEPRIATITVAALIFYLFFEYRLAILKYIKIFLIPLSIAVGIHFYWVLPTIILRKESYDAILSSFGWIGFLSFADFSNSFSLLHPNWPENIFGKTYFFRPEFLILPILAYSSLFFVKKNKSIISFSLLGLIGAFLAKGDNPPFGEIYLWLFKNILGMNLFRDATKFYVLVALSYSVLIPFSISEIHRRLSATRKTPHVKRYLPKIFLLLATCSLLFLIKPAVLGELEGTFKEKVVPEEYLVLKEFLVGQEEFFRTFWVPKKQRFGFFSNKHPAISTENFLTDTVCLEPFCSLKTEMLENWGKDCPVNDRCYVRELSYFLNPKTAESLSQMAVKYVIVPSDLEGEIFVKEHRYNPQQREEVEEFLDTIDWLQKVKVVDGLAVYQVPEPKDHFFFASAGSGKITDWKTINPTKYVLSLKVNQTPAKLVFSETYDDFWRAKTRNQLITPKPYQEILTSFEIERVGDFDLKIEFVAQKYVYQGGVVSLITLILVGGILVWRFFPIVQKTNHF